MRDDREVAGEQIQLGPLLRRGVEIMVGRDLQEIDAVAVAKQFGEEWLAEPDPDPEHRQVAVHGVSLHSHRTRHLRIRLLHTHLRHLRILPRTRRYSTHLA